MKIAILGTRGIPAKYGGFETFAEELSQRLAALGNEVWVYGRKNYYNEKELVKDYKGTKLVFLNSIKIRYFETALHTLFSALHIILKNRVNCVILCNNANFFVIPLLRLFSIKVFVNVDGLEWKRKKWGILGKFLHKAGERLTVLFNGKRIIVDSKVIGSYYSEKYKIRPIYLTYGAKIIKEDEIDENILEKFGLYPGEYFLQITRFVPENNVLLTVEAFKKIKTHKKLVLIGGDYYNSSYSKEIKSKAEKDNRVILPGFIYDKRIIDTFLYYSFAYIHGNEVGGTNPSLLQAMGGGNIIIAIDTSYNREVLGDIGLYFNNLRTLIDSFKESLEMNPDDRDYRIKREVERIRRDFDWDKIAQGYMDILK